MHSKGKGITRLEFSFYGRFLKTPEHYVKVIRDIFSSNGNAIDEKMFRQVSISHYWS